MVMFTVANLANLTLRVALAAFLAPRYGIQMVWYVVPLGWAVNGILSHSQYRTGRWARGAAKKQPKDGATPPTP